MSHSRSAVAITTLLLLILCCQTGSLLVISPTDLTKFASDSAKFECHFDSCAGLRWNGPATDLPAHYTITTESSQFKSVLTINNLTENDEGQYFCTCNGRNSSQADLIVHHYPNVYNVRLNQTFQRGDMVVVECASFTGDPGYPLLWIRNGMRIQPDSNNQKTLTIINIDDEHAGVYECGFNVLGKLITASIMVNIEESSETMDETIICRPSPSFLFSYARRQPLNLTCDCRTDQSDTSLKFLWNIHHLRIVQNSSLIIPYDQVSSGAYSCQASRDGILVEQHIVVVTVVDIPPLPKFPGEIEDARKRERETAHLRYEFILPLDTASTSLNFQWKKIYAGSNTNVDFSSRFEHSVSGTTLRLSITKLVPADAGTYVVNISNQYGYSELHAVIYVEGLDRTEVTLEFKAISVSCDSIEMNKEDIIAQVVEKVKGFNVCPSCEEVELDQEIDTSCTLSDDQATVMFQLTLISSAPLDLMPSNAVSLMIAESNVTAELCSNDCPVSSSPPNIRPPGDTSVIVAVVVSVLITCLVVVLVLISTFTIRKLSRGICDKHQVDHMQDQPEVVVMPIPAECTGYVRVNRTEPPHTAADPVDPTATPVSVPFPPHIPPTAKAKRPDCLYIRSHSYHGSTRTPQA